MSARKLPVTEPCPCGKGCRVDVLAPFGHWRAYSLCGFAGPQKDTARSAILAWNRRSDDAAERRGAMVAADWLTEQGLLGTSARLRDAIERGEVAGKPEPWIVSNPGVMGGKPCVRGTRITVETIQNVSQHWPFLQILKEYPSLTPVSLAAVLLHIWREDCGEVTPKRGWRRC